jgi:hypothetical protein
MTSKERVLNTINHKQPDAVPIDFGSTATTGMHVSCVAALRDFYGLDKHPVKVHEPYQMLGFFDDDLKDTMGIDFEGIFPPETAFGFPNNNWKEWRMDDGLDVLVSDLFITTKDENGDTLIYPKGDLSAPPSGKMPKDGFFFDVLIRQKPLEEDKLDPSDNAEEFEIISDSHLDFYANEAKKAAKSGRGVVCTLSGMAFGDISMVPAPFLKYPKGIRDVEEWYISTITRRNYIHKVFEKQKEIALINLAKIKKAVGDVIDVVFVCGTDFGTQLSTFCSEETFRELYMPYYKEVNNWIHKNTNWKIFKHSCGAINPLINAIIESGFDILNPVQCSAKGMDPKHLKKKFGEEIVFWGAGVDTQKTLPFGKPDEVRKQVLKRCETFAKNGGFVFNSIHNVQANTPVENIVAMFDAVKEFNS